MLACLCYRLWECCRFYVKWFVKVDGYEICMHAMHVCSACMLCMHACYVFTHAVYACMLCVHAMNACYACMHAMYVCMRAMYVCMHVMYTCMQCMHACHARTHYTHHTHAHMYKARRRPRLLRNVNSKTQKPRIKDLKSLKGKCEVVLFWGRRLKPNFQKWVFHQTELQFSAKTSKLPPASSHKRQRRTNWGLPLSYFGQECIGCMHDMHA